jgi:hypothetical protein
MSKGTAFVIPRISPGKLMRPLVSLMIVFLLLSPAHAAPPGHEGRKDAIDYCSACHRVTRDQKQPPAVFDPDEARSVEAPAFDVIAGHYSGRPGALSRFIRAPLHPMREQQFLPRDLRAITRYITSLRGERW